MGEWLDLRDHPGVSVQVARRGDRLRIVGVQIRRDEGVSIDDLRSVPIGRLEAAVTAQFADDRKRVAAMLTKAAEANRPPTRRELRLPVPNGRRYPDDHYEKVARLYLRLVSNGRPPTPALADANKVPPSTVHRWIKEARRRGFLPPARAAGATG